MAKESLKAREVKRKNCGKICREKSKAESRRRFSGTQQLAQEFKSDTFA